MLSLPMLNGPETLFFIPASNVSRSDDDKTQRMCNVVVLFLIRAKENQNFVHGQIENQHNAATCCCYNGNQM